MPTFTRSLVKKCDAQEAYDLQLGIEASKALFDAQQPTERTSDTLSPQQNRVEPAYALAGNGLRTQEVPKVGRKAQVKLGTSSTNSSHKSKRITKATSKTPIRRKSRKGKLVVLKIRYQHLPRNTLKQFGIKSTKQPKNYFPYPTKPGLKLGHNHWDLVGWTGPSEEQVREVHDLLKSYHDTFQVEKYIATPAHASAIPLPQMTANIDMLLQTIFAQTTGNENAIDTHSRLCNTYVYEVLGRKFVGTMPDWHKIRLLERDKFASALQQGGLHLQRAKYIQGTLNAVYTINEERKRKGQFDCEYVGNPPGATDFVPGMLSLDYLMVGDNGEQVSDEVMLGRLLTLPGIGIKSAMCVLAFGFHRPLFVVDTHVLRMTKWLGWIPRSAKEDHAAMFLHSVIPEDLRYDLHQLFWVHCANENVRQSQDRITLCPFCGATPPAKSRDVSNFKCPIANLLPPYHERWTKKYEPLPDFTLSRQKVTVTGNIIVMDIVDANLEAKPDQNIVEAGNGLLTPPSTPEHVSPYEQITLPSQGFRQSATSRTKPGKKTKQQNPKPYKFGKSVRFTQDIHEDKLQALHEQGYLLFEFRPLDDNFMEDRALRDVKPRYKFEKPEFMDPDVAVSVEHARAVLLGKRPHKWSGAGTVTSVVRQIGGLSTFSGLDEAETMVTKEIWTPRGGDVDM